MKTDQCQTVKEIMNRVEGADLHQKKGGKFLFPMYLNRQMTETPIDALDLSPRAYNCLKRAEYSYIGELAEATASGDVLKTIRNCGTKSAHEIMEKMFIYQYEVLSPERKQSFLESVVAMNAGKQMFGE